MGDADVRACRSDAQRDLVGELAGAGVTALGFGEGVVFKRVPGALLEAAAEREFPILAVPFESPSARSCTTSRARAEATRSACSGG